LFLISGLIYRLRSTASLEKLGGLYKDYPKISLLLAIPLFSLVGIPPLSGFWPKISLMLASFDEKNYWFLGAVIFGSLITLIIIAKVWSEAFWKDPKPVKKWKKFVDFSHLKPIQKVQLIFPIAFLSIVSLYIGFGAEPIQQLSERIASELMDNQQYIDAVFKTRADAR
jgi:multicomponent Na+:H+ antiporter subunit D